ATDALPFLLAGLLLALLAAGVSGAVSLLRRRWTVVCAAVLVAAPALWLLDAGVFYDRTRSTGLGLGGALFVAAFAGAISGAAACALFAPSPQARFASS